MPVDCMLIGVTARDATYLIKVGKCRTVYFYSNLMDKRLPAQFCYNVQILILFPVRSHPCDIWPSNQIIWLIIHTWTVQIIEYRNTQTCPQEANMIVHCECVHCQLWYVFPNSREPWSKCVCVCVCTIWLCHWTYIWQHPLISPSIPSCDYNGQEYNYESHLMHVYM